MKYNLKFLIIFFVIFTIQALILLYFFSKNVDRKESKDKSGTSVSLEGDADTSTPSDTGIETLIETETSSLNSNINSEGVSFPCIPCNENEQKKDKEDETKLPNLMISILSIMRGENGLGYLEKTLESIDYELSGSVLPNTTVLVYHPREQGTHFELNRCKKRFPKFNYYEKASPIVPPGKTWEGKWRETRQKDVQQNYDVIGMFSTVEELHCKSEKKDDNYVLLMEDDFIWCPHAMQHLQRIMGLAHGRYKKKWSVIRVSYGLNGVIMSCNDLSHIIDHIKQGLYWGPCDAILGEYWTMISEEAVKNFNNRVYMVYRHNLFNHIGSISTISAPDPITKFPQCYDPIRTHGLKVEERFDMERCGDKEFTPCDTLKLGSEQVDRSILMVRSHPEFDASARITETLTHVDIVTGDAGLDCHEVCSKQSKNQTCISSLFSSINHCDTLKKYFSCGSCEPHYFTINDEGTRNPYFLQNTGDCHFSAIPTLMRCEGRNQHAQRLCPCGKIKEVSNRY